MTIRPSAKSKRRISDLEATRRAQAAMTSELGQKAIREQWARGLYRFVFDRGYPPADMLTIDGLKRAANAFRWDLAEMRKTVDRKDPLQAVNLSLMETAEAFENELREQYLKRETAALPRPKSKPYAAGRSSASTS